MSSIYFDGDYLWINYFQSDYFDVGSSPSSIFNPILLYYPANISINISDNPYVVFAPPIQTGTILFTLTQSGGINVPGTTSYNSGTYTDIFEHQYLLNPLTQYIATVSGISQNGPFLFSYNFMTNNVNAGGNANKYRIIVPIAGQLGVSNFNIELDIN